MSASQLGVLVTGPQRAWRHVGAGCCHKSHRGVSARMWSERKEAGPLGTALLFVPLPESEVGQGGFCVDNGLEFLCIYRFMK